MFNTEWCLEIQLKLKFSYWEKQRMVLSTEFERFTRDLLGFLQDMDLDCISGQWKPFSPQLQAPGLKWSSMWKRSSDVTPCKVNSRIKGSELQLWYCIGTCKCTISRSKVAFIKLNSTIYTKATNTLGNTTEYSKNTLGNDVMFLDFLYRMYSPISMSRL